MEKKNVLSGLIWQFAERCGAQSIQFVVSIILARLLTPADYGLIGLITVFITISAVFAQSGLGDALVQRIRIDNEEFSTVFYFSLVFSFILYGILFFVAPIIANFYNEPTLVNVVRVLGLTVIIGAVNSVQRAYVQKTMQFKRFFWSTLFGTIVSAFIGIYMAYKGCGVWSLVAQQMTNQIIDTLILWFTVRWRPILAFSLSKARRLFSFGWKILCSTLIDTIYNNIYSLIIGKFYSSSDLGYYNRGDQFPALIINNVNAAISGVMYPAMSNVQNEKSRLKSMLCRAIKTGTLVSFPVMAIMAAVAKPLTTIFLTEKWLPAVPFIQFCCFIYALWPINSIHLQAIKALGRSDILLRIEILKKISGFVILVITIPFGVYAMIIGKCVFTLLCVLLNVPSLKKLLGYSYWEQIKDILPPFVISVFTIIVVMFVPMFNLNNWSTMIIQIALGLTVYVGVALIFRVESMTYMMKTAKELILTRKTNV